MLENTIADPLTATLRPRAWRIDPGGVQHQCAGHPLPA
jgi:hypothetical protein